MDPAQGETGGKSLTSKLKARVPHVKDTVKNLKSRLPGKKKHGSGDDEGGSESYDDVSPRSPGTETGYNVADSTPYSTVKTTTSQPDSNFGAPVANERMTSTSPRDQVVHNRDSDWSRASRASPYGYDSQNRSYVAAAPPTRPAPMATDSPRSNVAPSSLEDKLKHLDVTGEKSPRAANPHSYVQPEQETYSPSTIERVRKGYSDVPRDSYRASPTTPTSANKGMVEKVRESMTGAAVVLGDKMGYYNDKPAAPAAPTPGYQTNAPSILDKAKSTLGLNKPRDPNAPSVADKAKSTLGLDKPSDPNAPSVVDKAKSTLGLDKPRDPNAPPVTEKAKAYVNVATQKTREYGATAADHAAWTKDRVVAQTTPTHHDKALSEQVTESLSNLPGTIREKVFGPASPSSATATANSPQSPGIVDRVSGAVSSLLTAAPKQTAERRQDTFPAHSDNHGSAVPQNVADRTSAEERRTPAAYPPTSSTVNSY